MASSICNALAAIIGSRREGVGLFGKGARHEHPSHTHSGILLRQLLASQNKALDYISAQHEPGAVPGLDLNQQQSLTAATQTRLTLLEDQRATRRRSPP